LAVRNAFSIVELFTNTVHYSKILFMYNIVL